MTISSTILKAIGLDSLEAMLFGSFSMTLGGAIWALTPAEIADGSMTGYLISDSGTKALLKLSDEELKDFARTDERVSTRIMQIYTALAVIERSQK
jgi:hypothetical protein